MEFRNQDGGEWTAEGFEAEMKRLGR